MLKFQPKQINCLHKVPVKAMQIAVAITKTAGSRSSSNGSSSGGSEKEDGDESVGEVPVPAGNRKHNDGGSGDAHSATVSLRAQARGGVPASKKAKVTGPTVVARESRGQHPARRSLFTNTHALVSFKFVCFLTKSFVFEHRRCIDVCMLFT